MQIPHYFFSVVRLIKWCNTFDTMGQQTTDAKRRSLFWLNNSNALGSPAIQVFIECIAGSKYMNTSLPRQFASCTREGLVFTGMHKSRYESSLHLICFLPRIKRGTTSTGMTKYHCLLNINNINKLIMQNSVAN